MADDPCATAALKAAYDEAKAKGSGPGVLRSDLTLPPWGCKCGNWTDQETCEACGRTLDRTEEGSPQ